MSNSETRDRSLLLSPQHPAKTPRLKHHYKCFATDTFQLHAPDLTVLIEKAAREQLLNLKASGVSTVVIRAYRRNLRSETCASCAIEQAPLFSRQ